MSPHPNKLLTLVLIAALSSLLAVGGTRAHATESPPPSSTPDKASVSSSLSPTAISAWTYRYSVAPTAKYINRAGAQVLGRCLIGTKGGTCTISKGKSATRSIELSGGLTRGMIAGSLGFSSSFTETVDVSCTSPALSPGATWTAKPLGTKHVYSKKRTTHFWGVQVGAAVVTTGLRAFNPYQSQIFCY